MAYDQTPNTNQPRPGEDRLRNPNPGLPTRKPSSNFPVLAMLGAGAAILLVLLFMAGTFDRDSDDAINPSVSTTTTTPDSNAVAPDTGTVKPGVTTTAPETDTGTTPIMPATPDDAGQNGTTGTNGNTQPNTTP